MITFYYDQSKKEPLYEQLYRYLKEAIEKNELKSNEKLPSKRKLALHLKISQTTIESAYSQLLAEGYIKSVPKVGFFVMENLHFSKKRSSKVALKKVDKPIFKFDFKTNMIDVENFPYKKFAKIERDIILDQLSPSINHMDYFGIYSLREKIADILFAYRGIEALPEQIVIGSGSEHLISLLVLLLGREKLILTEEPSYIKNYLLYKDYGAKVDVCELDESGISVQALNQKNADVIHMTPSHQYPTGIITPITRRIELLQWVNQKENRFIVEDDYDSEFRFSGNPIPALKVLDQFDKVIYMNSFSKSIAPSFRVSFMVLPRVLVKRYQHHFNYFSCSVSVMTQLTLEKFIESNEFDKHLNRMKIIYKGKRDQMIQALNQAFGSKIRIKGMDSGLHFLVEVITSMSESTLIELAKKQNIRVYGLGEYYIKKINRYLYPTLIFGYSHFKLDEIDLAIQKLQIAWKEI